MSTRSSRTLEIQAKAGMPLGMPPGEFLRKYWQKRPLLIRQAFPEFESPVSPDDLAGLACEEIAPSRIVVHRPRGDRWELRHGPFAEGDFARLPKTRWTLLVQDCDKLLAEVGALLGEFRFVPDWRLDDVMISYAVDGGSVGPHLDQYDVFLLQAQGRRRWSISVDPHAATEFRQGLPLKLLQSFSATHEWVLEPGDMLYLPPGIPHHGVAEGECMTWSIGMRAPSVAELLIDFAEGYAARHGEESRYSDPQLALQREPAEISNAAIAGVSRLLRKALAGDGEAIRDGFARFITRYRSSHEAVPARRPLQAPALKARMQAGAVLHRSPWSRIAFLRDARPARAVLYCAGEAYPCTLKIAKIVANASRWEHAELARLTTPEWNTIAALHNAGHLVLARA